MLFFTTNKPSEGNMKVNYQLRVASAIKSAQKAISILQETSDLAIDNGKLELGWRFSQCASQLYEMSKYLETKRYESHNLKRLG